MSSPPLADKVFYFEQLDALTREDTDEEYGENDKETRYRAETRSFFAKGTGRALASKSQRTSQNGSQTASSVPESDSNLLQQRKFKPTAVVQKDTPRSRTIEVTPLLRRATTTAHVSATGKPSNSFVGETPIPDTAIPNRHATLQRSTTLPTPALARLDTVEHSPSISSTMRKRKREPGSLNMAPEAEQIFRGLAFYYIPDNDIAPLRKMRITRAREHGAQWIRSLAGATHVVVDKNLTFKDIENVLAKAGSPAPVMVNEDYPIDCIQFRNLLNPVQHRYRVPGCPMGGEAPAASPAEVHDPTQISEHSLQVKERPAKLQRLESTASGGSTSRAEDSVQQNAVTGSVATPVAVEEPKEIAPGTVDEMTVPQSPDLSVQPHESSAPKGPQRTDSVGDELSEFISLIQQYKDLPLDDEDDDLQSVRGGPSQVSDSEEETVASSPASRKRNHTPKKAGQKTITHEERFACNTGGTKDAYTASTNPNARTIEVLQSMCDYYSKTNDHWRTTAYRKAIATLKRQTTRITTAKEAYQLPNVGPRLADKIEEIVNTNKLRRLESAQADPMSPILELFLGIYEVGLSRANKWISQGYRTLDDLLANADLNKNQRIGIERFEDLNTRIPRAEVEALGAHVRRTAQKIDPVVELLVGGSYRRGADSSGDIDFIVTKKGTTSATDLVPFLDELVNRLTNSGFLVAALAAHTPGKGGQVNGGSKWHGCCVLPVEEGRAAVGKDFKPLWRRIDFLLVPESEYGAALIYFTGNDIFNRSIRLLASRKGMRLNQRGLYKEVMVGPNRVKVTEGQLVEGRDEKKIFEILGVKWREPRERWC